MRNQLIYTLIVDLMQDPNIGTTELAEDLHELLTAISILKTAGMEPTSGKILEMFRGKKQEKLFMECLNQDPMPDPFKDKSSIFLVKTLLSQIKESINSLDKSLNVLVKIDE